jgi:hypothetical protein
MRLDFFFGRSMRATIALPAPQKKWPVAREVRQAKSHAAGGDGKVSREALSDRSLSRTFRYAPSALIGEPLVRSRGPPRSKYIEEMP